jgi:CRP-like cAMP-binding protein
MECSRPNLGCGSMTTIQTSTANLLLRALVPADFLLLESHLERVSLNLKDPLFSPGEPIDCVYFLEDGVASIVSDQEGGEMVEVGLYGREGMSGTAVLLGAGQSPLRSMVQVGNPIAQRIESGRLLEACAASIELNLLLMRYAQCLNIQAALTAASNAQYALPERLARWLLMCHDRTDGDRMELTHEFLSMMLAVRRSGVTVTLHTLEATGAIRSSRGVVVVMNRSRLEEIAGESYGQAEAEYRRLIRPFGRGRHGMERAA